MEGKKIGGAQSSAEEEAALKGNLKKQLCVHLIKMGQMGFYVSASPNITAACETRPLPPTSALQRKSRSGSDNDEGMEDEEDDLDESSPSSPPLVDLANSPILPASVPLNHDLPWRQLVLPCRCPGCRTRRRWQRCGTAGSSAAASTASPPSTRSPTDSSSSQRAWRLSGGVQGTEMEEFLNISVPRWPRRSVSLDQPDSDASELVPQLTAHAHFPQGAAF